MKLELLSNFQFKLLLGRIVKPRIIALDIGSQNTGVAHSCDQMK